MSQAPLAKLQTYKRRMGWSFPWASSHGSDFNFQAAFTEEQQREEIGDEVAVAVARWKMLWEAAQFRRRIFDEDDLPPLIADIADRGDTNVVFVPRTRTRYYESHRWCTC